MIGAAYVPPSGVTDSLVKTEEGTFALTTLDQAVYRFDASGRIASITDDHGLKTTYGYSGEGRLSTITDPSGQTLTFAYNGSNHMTVRRRLDRPRSQICLLGRRRSRNCHRCPGRRDEIRLRLRASNHLDHRPAWQRDPEKRLRRAGAGSSNRKTGSNISGHSNTNRAKRLSPSPTAANATYGFDGQDRVVSETDQLGHTTTIAYDEAGNVDEVVQPGGAKWEFGHDVAGNLTVDQRPRRRRTEIRIRRQEPAHALHRRCAATPGATNGPKPTT